MFAAAAAPVASEIFREALSHVTTAVSLITTNGPGGLAGVTCSAVCAGSDDPPIVLVCVHGRSATNQMVKANGVFCVNCLRSDQKELSQVFAGVGRVAMADRFVGGDWDVLTTGAPHFKDALVALDCELLEARDIGTHSLFVARVLATAHAEPTDPLVYHRRAYATTKAV
jgi:flavin reductase (NADH)/flavin reductase/chlorophenol-4-monooxygenase component 1